MSQADWLSILGWKAEELEDLRFVGYSYIKQGKYDIATTFFEALVILSPNSVYDLKTLGAIYLQKGNNLMALNYMRKQSSSILQIFPTLLNRSKALFALGYKQPSSISSKILGKKRPETYCRSSASTYFSLYRTGFKNGC